MKTAVFLLTAALLAGCGAIARLENKEPPPLPFTGTRWQVMLEMPRAGEQPWVRFGDGRMEGFGGCSQFGASILQDSVGAKAIAIMRIELRQQGLCDANVVAAERRMLEVLQSVSSYSITVDVMKMSGSAGTLVFKAISIESLPK
jgi:heat shock protein HslJ